MNTVSNQSMPTIEIAHQGPESMKLGVVVAENLSAERYPSMFESELAKLLNIRLEELDEATDLWRRDVRDIFRNGRFKPTGRGKPASEYLLGAARKEAFPRINSLVDICNYISLRYVLPISVCDLDRAGSDTFLVRTGLEGEEYIFNTAGQTIGLEDLIIGCSVSGDGTSLPIVNAVKDSMRTKTTPESRRILALLYAPTVDPGGRLAQATREFECLISGCGDAVRTSGAIASHGESLMLSSNRAEG